LSAFIGVFWVFTVFVVVVALVVFGVLIGLMIEVGAGVLIERMGTVVADTEAAIVVGV